ncbi:hypothetical protein HEMROJRC1_08320 [Rodentibacter sp. JRC1]|nr:hypothetical protein HEMROJRC1_08320 [Rodentibacter sp. JRC1]
MKEVNNHEVQNISVFSVVSSKLLTWLYGRGLIDKVINITN